MAEPKKEGLFKRLFGGKKPVAVVLRLRRSKRRVAKKN